MAQEYGRYFGMRVCIFRGGASPDRHTPASNFTVSSPIWSRWRFLAAPIPSSATKVNRSATTFTATMSSALLKKLRPTRVVGRSTTSAVAVKTAFRCWRPSENRTNDREKDELEIRRGQPQGRSHLLHLRPCQVQISLSQLENHHWPRRNLPPDHRRPHPAPPNRRHVNDQRTFSGRHFGIIAARNRLKIASSGSWPIPQACARLVTNFMNHFACHFCRYSLYW